MLLRSSKEIIVALPNIFVIAVRFRACVAVHAATPLAVVDATFLLAAFPVPCIVKQ